MRGAQGSASNSNYFADSAKHLWPWIFLFGSIAAAALTAVCLLAHLTPKMLESVVQRQDATIAILQQRIESNEKLASQQIHALEERSRLSEREARVATERYADVAKELARRGMAVSDH